MGIALAEETVDVDVVMDDLVRLRQVAMEGDNRIEQAIARKATRLEVDAEIAGQEQVRLPGLDGDASWNSARVEIPGPGMNIVLGHHSTRAQRARFALDG